MKKIVLFMFFMVLSLISFDVLADSCRCGNRLVTVGDTISEVLAKCGPPTWVEERKEERLERIRSDSYYKNGTLREPVYANVQVNVEEWFYNFGSDRFMQVFIFENGRIVEITTGNYGY